MQPPRQRRRIDRITAPDYLDGVEDASAADVRAMRDECRELESQLSYVRRVLQGQLDISLVEARRRGGGEAPPDDLVASLPSILSSDAAPAPRDARNVTIFEPSYDGRRGEDADRFASRVGQVPDLDDAELERLVAELRAAEREVSDHRRVVLERLDALQAELVRRYRDGGASVDDVVVPTLAPGGDDRDR